MSELWAFPLVVIAVVVLFIIGITKDFNYKEKKAIAKCKVEFAYQTKNESEIIKALEAYVKVLEKEEE